MNNTANPTIIVGGGFVGLFTALHLSHHHYSEPVILIDPNDRFVFKPLLYEHLTEEMQNEQVLPRYEELLKGSKVTFVPGVEMAATLGDLLPQWYEKLGGDFEDLRLVLVNHSHGILKGDANSHLQDNCSRCTNEAY